MEFAEGVKTGNFEKRKALTISQLGFPFPYCSEQELNLHTFR